MRYQIEPNDYSDYEAEYRREDHKPLPFLLKNVVNEGSSELDAGDVAEVVAGGPEADNESPVLLGEPVAHDGDKAGKEEGVEDADKDLHEVVVGEARHVKEAGEAKQGEEDGKA